MAVVKGGKMANELNDSRKLNDLSGGKYRNLVDIETARKTQELIQKEKPWYYQETARKLSALDILTVVAGYLTILTLEEEKKETEETNRKKVFSIFNPKYKISKELH